jgi:hypothetical protein
MGKVFFDHRYNNKKKLNGCDLLLATLFQLFGFLLETKIGTPQYIDRVMLSEWAFFMGL